MTWNSVLLGGCLLAAGGVYLGFLMEEGPAWMVMIQDNAFSPRVVTIRAGDRVTWMNHDAASHNVESDPQDGPLGSPLLAQLRSWTSSFQQPGVYDYHCDPHAVRQAGGSYAGMTGRVVVEA